MAGGKVAGKDDSPYSFVPHTQYARALNSRRSLSEQQLCISIKQHPERARAFSGGVNEKTGDRRPLDPPPVVQLTLHNKRTGKTSNDVLHNPFYLCYASLRHADRDEDVSRTSEDDGRPVLMGQLVTSMARLKDTDNIDGAFFPFCNLVVTLEGRFRIMFTVFEISGGVVHCRGRACTNTFMVYGKAFPGVGESTPLCRMFAEQGVRLRVRKEPKLRRNKHLKRKPDSEPVCESIKRPMKRRSLTDDVAAHNDVAACVANFTACAKATNDASIIRRSSNAEIRPVDKILPATGSYRHGSITTLDMQASATGLAMPRSMSSGSNALWGINRPSPYLNAAAPPPTSPASDVEPPPFGTMSDRSRSPSAARVGMGQQFRRGSDSSLAGSSGTPSSTQVSRPTRISIDSLISCNDSALGKQSGYGSGIGKTASPVAMMVDRPTPPLLPPPRAAQLDWDTMGHNGRRFPSMPSPLAGVHAGRASHGPIAAVALSKLDDALRGSSSGPSLSSSFFTPVVPNSFPWQGHDVRPAHAQHHHARVYGQSELPSGYGSTQGPAHPPHLPPMAHPPVVGAAQSHTPHHLPPQPQGATPVHPPPHDVAAPALAASKLYSHLYIAQQPRYGASVPQQVQPHALASNAPQ
ncbi:hypothetical protein HDU86_000154 [Geranomyces michiganensis]|nr:hypothetical protein HDU86_000154 [Geranomyces michiganensis]